MPQGRVGIRKPNIPQFPGRGLVELLTGPLDEPQMPVPGAVGVTTFLKGGVPDVVGRRAATNQSLKQLLKMLGQSDLPQERAQQVMQVAERYPRVLAHQDIGYLPPSEWSRALGQNIATKQRLPGRSLMNLSQPGMDPDLPNTFVHELGHGAQRIGQKELMDPLYQMFPDAYETSANAMAQRRIPSIYQTARANPNLAPAQSGVQGQMRGQLPLPPDMATEAVDLAAARQPEIPMSALGRLYRLLAGVKR